MFIVTTVEDCILSTISASANQLNKKTSRTSNFILNGHEYIMRFLLMVKMFQ